MFRVRRGLSLRLYRGFLAGKPEVRMIKSAIKLATLTLFSMALIASPPTVPALAAGGGGGGGGDPPAATPPPPDTRYAPKSTSRTKKKANKQSSLDDAAFREGYRAAYATIYDRNDYAAAIGQLKALGHDDNAECRQSDRLLLSQARRLQALANLVRARAESEPEPRADLAVLRAVANRAGQSRPGVVSSEPDRGDLRNRLRGISLVGCRARTAARHRTRLLSAMA